MEESRRFQRRLAVEWKTSDALAILTLIGGLVSYSVNAYKDRELKTAEHANKVRVAAAQLLGKTNALHQAVPSAVLQAQQRVVETKLRLLTKYEPNLEMHGLWGTLLKSKADALQNVASLQTDPSYLAFYTFSPATKGCMDAAIERINQDLIEGYENVLAAVEEARLELPIKQAAYVPAHLYNRISSPLVQMQRSSAMSIQAHLAPIEGHLTRVIARANDALVAERMQVDAVPGCIGSAARLDIGVVMPAFSQKR
jgi:hypothetical protein